MDMMICSRCESNQSINANYEMDGLKHDYSSVADKPQQGHANMEDPSSYIIATSAPRVFKSAMLER